jgi:hypothetical protein
MVLMNLTESYRIGGAGLLNTFVTPRDFATGTE